MDLVNRARQIITAVLPSATQAIDILEDQNMTEDQRNRAATVLWESLKSLTDILDTIQLNELDCRDTLIGEAKHFNMARQNKNDLHARYMRRWRNDKADKLQDNAIGKPIKTRPRSNPEQVRQLHELHKRLWNIEEKESWLASELFDVISATIPKQTGTAILDEMIASKRIIRNKTTDRYEIENPNAWETNNGNT